MIGPWGDCLPCMFSWCCILVGSSVFMFFVGKILYNNAIIFFIVYIYVIILNITCLLCTCCTDPGIVPRRPIFELEEKIPGYFIDDVVTYNKGSVKEK